MNENMIIGLIIMAGTTLMAFQNYNGNAPLFLFIVFLIGACLTCYGIYNLNKSRDVKKEKTK